MPTISLHSASVAATAAAAAHNIPIHCFPSSIPIPVILRKILQTTSHPVPSILLAVDPAAVASQLALFGTHLPTVHVHYAIKCFPDPVIVHTLAALGASFDVASPFEINLANNALQAVGVQHLSNRVIYANPVKTPSQLRLARSLGIDLLTFDAPEELHKLATHFPNARALLRLSTDDKSSVIPLSAKFGAFPNQVCDLLALARQLNICVVGVAFHVGSGATSTHPYVSAMHASRKVFTLAETYGFNFNILDIGGGFPAVTPNDKVPFVDIATVINRLLPIFPRETRVLAEPGNFIVGNAVSTAARILHATSASSSNVCRYTVGEGIFGMFHDAHVTKAIFTPYPLIRAATHADNSNSDDDGSDSEEEIECNLYGPTDEPCDIIGKGFRLPRMECGDWLWFKNTGSYTMSLRTRRSDLEEPRVEYIFRQDGHLDGEVEFMSLEQSNFRPTDSDKGSDQCLSERLSWAIENR